MADTDWSNWQRGVPPVPAPRRDRGVPIAASVGLLLVLAAALMIGSGIAFAVIHIPSGALGLQGRLSLAAAGANPVTALTLIAAILLVRPSAIGLARPSSGPGSGRFALSLSALASVVVVLAGGYDFIAAFTDRPVLTNFLGAAFSSGSPNLPVNYHIAALADGLAVLLLGAAALWLAVRALATD